MTRKVGPRSWVVDDPAVEGEVRSMLASTSIDEPSPEELGRLGATLAALRGASHGGSDAGEPGPPELPSTPSAVAGQGSSASMGVLGVKTVGIVVVGVLAAGTSWMLWERPSGPDRTDSRASHLGREGGDAKVEVRATGTRELLPTEPRLAMAATNPSASSARGKAPPQRSGQGQSVTRQAPRSRATETSASGSVTSTAPSAEIAGDSPPKPNGAPTELQLLREATRALRSGDGPRALRLTSTYQEHYPAGVYAQEFERIAVEAWLQVGNRTQAKKLARRFFQRYPHSAHRQRIEALLEDR